MKTVMSLCLLLSSTVCLAQNTIFAGKITDATGKPVIGAMIQVKGGAMQADAKSNKSGLYHTELLPAGDYSVTVIAGGKTVKGASKVHLVNSEQTKTYYLLQVNRNRLNIAATEKDVFMETQLARIEEQQKFLDLPVNAGRMQIRHEDKEPVGGDKEIFILPKERKLEAK